MSNFSTIFITLLMFRFSYYFISLKYLLPYSYKDIGFKFSLFTFSWRLDYDTVKLFKNKFTLFLWSFYYISNCYIIVDASYFHF